MYHNNQTFIRNSTKLSILSWNINSLKKRIEDVRGKMIADNIDIVCLQECRVPENSSPPKIASYISYNLESTHSCIMYIKKSIPHKLLPNSNKTGTQYHGVTVHIGDSMLNVLNIYAPIKNI